MKESLGVPDVVQLVQPKEKKNNRIHINRIKDKNPHILISIDKVFDKSLKLIYKSCKKTRHKRPHV